MNVSKKLIIFDLDGTLVNSLPDIAASLNHVASHYGVSEFSENCVRSYVGDGARMLIRRAFPEEKFPRGEALELFLSYYSDHLVDRTRLFPGIEGVLEALKGHGFTLGVLSNKPERLSRDVVAYFRQLRDSVSFVYGGDSFSEKKPSPVPVLEILREQSLDTAIIVGDSPNDIRAGKSAGIHTIGVGYGFTPIKVLAGEKPDSFVEFPAQLTDAILTLMRK